MPPPSFWWRFRQIIGRALRETGQALDRVGLQTQMLATTKYSYYDDPCIFQDYLSRHRHRMPLLYSGQPLVHAKAAYIAPCSTLIGSVRIHPGASVWYGAVLRADEVANATNVELPALSNDRWMDRIHHHGGVIVVGENSNIQDGCLVTSRVNHCIIGKGVTVGHLAQIHSATIGDFCLIGMGCIVQEGAIVESEALVAAGAVVPPGTIVKTGELWVGNPARKLRDLTSDQRARLQYQSAEYVKVARGQQDVMLLGGNLGATEVTVEDVLDDGRLVDNNNNNNHHHHQAAVELQETQTRKESQNGN